MAIHVRIATNVTTSLAIAIEQLSTGLKYDFSTGTFVADASVVTKTFTLSTSTYFPSGAFLYDLASTPIAVWSDGEYAFCAIDNLANKSLGFFSAVMAGGDSLPGVLSAKGLDRVVIDSGAGKSIQARQTLATLLAFASNLNEAGVLTIASLPLSGVPVASVAETPSTRIATLTPAP